MKILRTKLFTSKRTKALRERLLQDQINKESLVLTRPVTEFTITPPRTVIEEAPKKEGLLGLFQKQKKTVHNYPANYNYKGNGVVGMGVLDKKLAHKMGVDPKIIGESRELTGEELNNINKKLLTDEVKKQQRKQNKDVFSWDNNADKLKQKELNKFQDITFYEGRQVGRSNYKDKITKDDIKKANDFFTDKNYKVVSAFDQERQEALNKFRAEKQAKTSKESIARHKSQAEKLRADNRLGIAARDAKRWIKRNPGKSTAIGAATIAAGTALGYGIKKHNKKTESDKK